MQMNPFPPFDLKRLLNTIFSPKNGEKLCILIDLKNPQDVVNFAFLKKDDLIVQKKAYEVFYQGLKKGVMKDLGLSAVDLFAYESTGGSNLDLPAVAISPEGKIVNFKEAIYPEYQIILCISDFSATAPLTALAKKYNFRGGTLHGLNDIILNSGLAVDYLDVSRKTEKLRKGLTRADSMEIDFGCLGKDYHLTLELGKQEAQKSHGLCPSAPDVVNLPAGEVYFVPINATGSFPIKLDEGTLALMMVENCKVTDVKLLKGNQKAIDELQKKFKEDPAAGVLGELGFGTQILPVSGADIQDEKIFGTFHIATGRNDHLAGNVTPDLFSNPRNATHEDILFSKEKTPEIEVKQVRMKQGGSYKVLIENYEPVEFLLNLHEDTAAR